MTAISVLHIDDEADIREVVAMSLELDPDFSVRSSASGEEGLAAAKESVPDLILLDVMMPVMDGPATLARLREHPDTSDIPVVFMTAMAQKGDLAHLKLLGAVGAIVKPFDPLELAKLVRGHLHVARLDTLGDHFQTRMRSDAAALTEYKRTLTLDPTSAVTLAGIQSQAHKLAGAAGIFGFHSVSLEASSLEKSVAEGLAGRGGPGAIAGCLDSLLACLDREHSECREGSG